MDLSEARYYFTVEGRVQFYRKAGKCGIIMTCDYETAEQFAEWRASHKDEYFTIVEVGAVKGETLEVLLAASVAEGGNGVSIITRVDEAGAHGKWFDYRA
jgi:hypothetical protein